MLGLVVGGKSAQSISRPFSSVRTSPHHTPRLATAPFHRYLRACIPTGPHRLLAGTRARDRHPGGTSVPLPPGNGAEGPPQAQ